MENKFYISWKLASYCDGDGDGDVNSDGDGFGVGECDAWMGRRANGGWQRVACQPCPADNTTNPPCIKVSDAQEAQKHFQKSSQNTQKNIPALRIIPPTPLLGGAPSSL